MFLIIHFVNYFDTKIKMIIVKKALYPWGLWLFNLRQYSFKFPLLRILQHGMLYLTQHVVMNLNKICKDWSKSYGK